MFDHKQLKKSISCLAWMFLFCAAAYSQQESRQGVAQRSGTETAARVPGRPSDIISDNLERVAASADQILEVLYKEAGLTVEFKRLLAQDAGVSGQILEESDLTDVAVAERLRADLRARVLATRLLQRYGYLVPRLKPDSDLEAEQKLVRQERAQMLARAAERRDTLVENSTAERNAACDPRSVPECAFPPSLPEDRLQAVVFDMDGVIVDSHPAHRFAWREFLGTLGREVSDNELDFVMDGRKRKDILFHFLGALTDEQLREYGSLKDEFFREAEANIAPIPGSFEFIECIRRAGIPMAVATSASTNRTQSILKRMGLLTHFAAVVTGDHVREGKPDPSIYRLACQRIYCPPESAVAIEDAASGIRAAKGAGLKCIGIANSQSKDKLAAAGADYVLRDFLNLSLREFHAIVGM
jgi:HAD superfamily hydrolase (TIGR01509 family)